MWHLLGFLILSNNKTHFFKPPYKKFKEEKILNTAVKVKVHLDHTYTIMFFQAKYKPLIGILTHVVT